MRRWLAAALIWSVSAVAALADVERELEAALSVLFGSDVSLQRHQFLRDGPTVTGIAFPKYYLWVEGQRGAEEFRGAVRVADENGTIVATHFQTDAEIRENRGSLAMVFPAPLIPAIIGLATAGK